MYVGDSAAGKAVFANRDIKKGDFLIEFKGEKFKLSEIPKIVTPEDDRYVQVGRDLYFGPTGNFDDYTNHSCDPNCGLFFEKGHINLRAIRDIKKDEEITWDYSTTMDEDLWEADCLCGSKNCRGRIRDFKWLPKSVKERYVKLGIVPDYIIEKENKFNNQ